MMFLGLIHRIEKRQIFMMVFTADMAIQNVIGDSFRGATWVSIHNGGGVGWGNVMVVLVWFLMVQKRLQNA
jgi:hypothetical protein